MSSITITELAERCGVAVSTVSRAMNERTGISPRTRERILQVARETGYVPNAAAKNLKISSTRTVAVVFQGWTSELSNHILGVVRDQLADAGLDLHPVHVSDQDANTATIIRLTTERRLAGLVFLGRFGNKLVPDDPSLADYLAGVGIPVVFCTAMGLLDGAPSVSVDDKSGAAELHPPPAGPRPPPHRLRPGQRGILPGVGPCLGAALSGLPRRARPRGHRAGGRLAHPQRRSRGHLHDG